MSESDSSEVQLRRGLPLAAIRAFDAAAQLGSFKSAAEALGLTPSAVSHQIRSLEQVLGAKLFHRQGRIVVLSEAGARLAPHIRQGFTAFARGMATVQAGDRARRIRVSALAMFSQTVLIPNLDRFTARWPQYEVRIETTPAFVDFDREDVDVAIRVGDGRWPGLKATELLRISGVPVATADYAAERRLTTPADLAGARLIHDTALPMAWRRWLATQEIDREAQPADLWFDAAPATLHAAEQSLGVALAIDPLVRRWPGYGGRLRPLFPGISTPRSRYWLVRRPDSEADPKIRAFTNWVRAACRAFDEPAS